VSANIQVDVIESRFLTILVSEAQIFDLDLVQANTSTESFKLYMELIRDWNRKATFEHVNAGQ